MPHVDYSDYCNGLLARTPNYVTDNGFWAAARLVSGTCKFDRSLKSLLYNDLHWPRRSRAHQLQSDRYCASLLVGESSETWSTVAKHQFRKSPAVDNCAQYSRYHCSTALPAEHVRAPGLFGRRSYTLWNFSPDCLLDPTLSSGSFTKLLKT